MIPRTILLGALAATVMLGACIRRRAARAVVDARVDSARRAWIAEASRADSARRDSVTRDLASDATVRDSLRRADSVAASTPAARRRRTAASPASRCGVVNFNENPETARLQSLADGQGRYVSYVGGGAVARCEGVNSRLRADSAEYFQSAGFLVLVGNVAYDEPGRASLTSDRLTYYTGEERVVAEGNVVVRLPSGTTMRGPTAEYLRAVPPIRTISRLTATGRPTVRAVGGGERRGTARADRPDTSITTIVANTVIDDDESLVYASGNVNIVRSDVTADADSATFDQLSEQARLVRNATIRGTRGRPFTLTGTLVDLYTRDRDLSRVKAQGQAHVVSQELDLRSDTVDLRLAASLVERAWAWGPSRAFATSPERDVIADSIEAWLPRQRVRELRAVRRALAQSVPDTTRIRSTDRDQLRGDTIVAHFDSVAARAGADSARTPPVRRILALGNATSLYQIASRQGVRGAPSLNYVRGRRITVDFDSNQVQQVTVTDQAAGVYLEPTDSTRPADAPARASAPAAPAAPAARSTEAPAGPAAPAPARRAPAPPGATASPAARPARPGASS